MAVTKTPRLNLGKQTLGDLNWHNALNTGFDDADARLLDISTDNSYTPLVEAVTFVGSGLDDGTSGGTMTGARDLQIEVEIDTLATPDTFRWSKDGGKTYEAINVALSLSAVALVDGVTILWAATTGHTIGDKWTFGGKAGDPQDPNDIDGVSGNLAVDYVGQRYYAELDDIWWVGTNVATDVWVKEDTLLIGAVNKNQQKDVQVDAATGIITINKFIHTPSGLPPMYIGGLGVESTSTTSARVNKGRCRDRLDNVDMDLSSIINKTLNGSGDWAAGDAANGFPVAIQPTVDDAQYSMWLISKEDGTVDAGFDTSETAANLLATTGVAYAAGFRYGRRVGYVMTTSGANLILNIWDSRTNKSTWTTGMLAGYIDTVDADYATANVVRTLLRGMANCLNHCSVLVSDMNDFTSITIATAKSGGLAKPDEEVEPGLIIHGLPTTSSVSGPVIMWFEGDSIDVRADTDVLLKVRIFVIGWTDDRDINVYN